MANPRRISHRMEPDGTVTIFLKSATGALIGSVNISESDARIHSWSVLSDVDPDQLEETYATTEEQGRQHQQAILAALLAGPATADAVAQAVDLPADEVGGRLMKLRSHGLVSKISSKGRAGSVFAITGEGIGAHRNGSRPDHSGGRRAA